MKFFINNIQILIGSFTAIIWAFFYFIFEKLHGMTEMYNEQFPFIVSNILGLDGNYLSIASGLLLATLDGLIVGYVLGWIVKRMFQ